jgi:hypothetical protein
MISIVSFGLNPLMNEQIIIELAAEKENKR